MANLFLLFCFGFMWLMIFGVILYYAGIVQKENASQVLLLGTVTLLCASFFWLAMGYSLSFYGNLTNNFFHLAKMDVVHLLVQLLFFLYGVVMVVGSVVERGNWLYLFFFIPLWMVLVYAPICYSLWGEDAWLAHFGVLDFSGGLVVHGTAGIASLILAQTLPKRSKQEKTTATQEVFRFIGMIFISLGWFGFNMAPVGLLNNEAIQIWLNTLLAIIGGGFSWFFTAGWLEKNFSNDALVNGILAGLVSSTCSVAYVSPGVSFLIAVIVSISCCFAIFFMAHFFDHLEDEVDSFGVNAVGGIVGSLLTGIFAVQGQFFIQVIGTMFVCIWSFVTCWLLHHLLRKVLPDQRLSVRSKITIENTGEE